MKKNLSKDIDTIVERLKTETFEQIADSYHVSKQAVWGAVHAHGVHLKRDIRQFRLPDEAIKAAYREYLRDPLWDTKEHEVANNTLIKYFKARRWELKKRTRTPKYTEGTIKPIHSEYLKDNVGIGVVAERHGMSMMALRYHFKRYGFKIRRSGRTKTKNQHGL